MTDPFSIMQGLEYIKAPVGIVQGLRSIEGEYKQADQGKGGIFAQLRLVGQPPHWPADALSWNIYRLTCQPQAGIE